MPTFSALGAKVKAKYPDYADMSDSAVGAAVAAKHPEYASQADPEVAGAGAGGVPSVAAHPGTDMHEESLGDALAPNNPGAGKPGGYAEALRPVGNAGRRVVRNLTQMVTDPASLTDNGVHAAADYDPLHPSFTAPNPVAGYIQTGRDKGVAQGVSDAVGDLATAEVLRHAIPAVTGAAGDAILATGRGVKGAGSLASRIAIGAPAAEDALGANAGRGLASNRIVGASPRSLARKVTATLEPASAARDAVLAASPSGPVDISRDVAAPFEAQTALKTDPVTGAAQPGAVRRLTQTRRVIQEETDPDTGLPTGDAKESRLFPSEMSALQRNLYDMTDYTTPEGGPTNTALKGAAGNLRTAIDTAAPEARPFTQNIHDLLGASDTLRETAQGGGHGLPDSKTGLIKGAATLAGTGVGAGLDALGTGVMHLGRAVARAGSPVAPVRPAAPEAPQVPPAPRQIEGGTPGEAPGPGPEDIAPTPAAPRGSPVAPAPPAPVRGALPAATPGEYANQSPEPAPASPRPTLNERTARNRTTPTTLAPHGQQVAPDQPGFVAPRGSRPLDVGPDGTITPRPYPLAAPAPVPLLESRTGTRAPSARPALLSQLRNEVETRATPAYVPPVVQPAPVERTAPAVPAKAKTKLTARVAPTAPAVPPAAPLGFRIPAPDDVAGWQALEDKGMAEYNAHTHSYDYTGPTNLTTKVKNAKPK